MRIAHATDIHWMEPPGSRIFNTKRLLGSANLFLRGRRHHFDLRVQSALVEHLLELEPDLVLITGDLTAQALPKEFDKARRALQPVLDSIPTFVIPGNHDVYTVGAQCEGRIRTWFSEWMGLREHSAITRLDHRDVTCLGLDPNGPSWLLASASLPQEQLIALAEELQAPGLEGRFVILAVHYPVLDRRGEVYDGMNHGLLNARDLIEVLERAPRRPDLIVHGHEHHGFHTQLELTDATVPIFNCGSSGYSFMPERERAAAMNLYCLAEGTLEVERYLYTDTGFALEPGGAYATGR